MTTPAVKKSTAMSDLEVQKLAFEREKQTLEERWRRKTFIWTIASTLLGVFVTFTAPLVTSLHKSDASQLTYDTVHACQNSLLRLPTLASLHDETVDDLRSAISKHVDTCNQVLDEMQAKLSKGGS
jgi:hypothetical protein